LTSYASYWCKESKCGDLSLVNHWVAAWCSRQGRALERYASELKRIKTAAMSASCGPSMCTQAMKQGRAWRDALELEQPNLSRSCRRRLAGWGRETSHHRGYRGRRPRHGKPRIMLGMTLLVDRRVRWAPRWPSHDHRSHGLLCAWHRGQSPKHDVRVAMEASLDQPTPGHRRYVAPLGV